MLARVAPFEGFTGDWLTHVVGKVVTAVGGRSQLLPMWASLKFLNTFINFRGRQREQERNINVKEKH